MPVVSINLSDEAYLYLIEQSKGDRSRVVSAALLMRKAMHGVKWQVVE